MDGKFFDYFKIYYIATVINIGGRGYNSGIDRMLVEITGKAEETAPNICYNFVHNEGACAGEFRGERTAHSVHGAGKTGYLKTNNKVRCPPHTISQN